MSADMRFQDSRDEAFSEFVEGLCYYFKQENPNFDRDRFVKACGFENGLYPEYDPLTGLAEGDYDWNSDYFPTYVIYLVDWLG